MDTELFRELHNSMPSFNRNVTRGLAVEQMKYLEEYIVRLIRCAELRFPEGVHFSHSQRCTPAEEFAYLTAKKSNTQYYEFAQTDVYLMKYFFTLKGKILKTIYLYLPYVSDGGVITITGNKFYISPVLADIAVSASDDNVFVPLNLDKLTFRRVMHHYHADGVRVASGVIYSEVYHISKKLKGGNKKTINAFSTLAHYIFAKYGVRQAFAICTGVNIVVGHPATVNVATHPSDKWIIFQSTQMKPYGVKHKFYSGTDIRVAVPREEYTPVIGDLIGGFFYVADRFPDQMNAEYVDNPVFWRILLGHVIFANDESEGKLLNKIDSHMTSLDGYIDAMSQEWLGEDKVYVETLYQLFMHIIETYSERTASAASTASTMYGKRLMVLRYILIDIIKAIFNTMFGLQAAAKKGLAEKDVENVMRKHLKPHLIHRINHKHGEIRSVSSSSACMSFKTTASIVLQTNITSGTSASKTNTITSANVLHMSIAEVGQYNNLPKGEPTGRVVINPFVWLDAAGITLQREETATMLNEAQLKLGQQ